MLGILQCAGSEAMSTGKRVVVKDRGPSTRPLLVAERLDRVEPGGPPRRVEAEEHPDRLRPRRQHRTASDVTGADHCIRRGRRTEAANPTPMPMAPPAPLNTIASTRNCSSMSTSRAPTAIRSPISRVRSVTDTSMMFMMPMPPTIAVLTPSVMPTWTGTRHRASLDVRYCDHSSGCDADVVGLRRARIGWRSPERIGNRPTAMARISVTFGARRGS